MTSWEWSTGSGFHADHASHPAESVLGPDLQLIGIPMAAGVLYPRLRHSAQPGHGSGSDGRELGERGVEQSATQELPPSERTTVTAQRYEMKSVNYGNRGRAAVSLALAAHGRRRHHWPALDPEVKHAIGTRLRRIEGQVRGLQKMVEEERYCADVLMQLSSVQEALRGVGRGCCTII